MIRRWLLTMCIVVWASAANGTQVQWFDGQHWVDAWVNDVTGEVALEMNGNQRSLANAIGIKTSPGQANGVAQALSALGLFVMPSPLPDKLYVRIAADQVLQTTRRLSGVSGITQIQLQWAQRVALPQRVH